SADEEGRVALALDAELPRELGRRRVGAPREQVEQEARVERDGRRRRPRRAPGDAELLVLDADRPVAAPRSVDLEVDVRVEAAEVDRREPALLGERRRPELERDPRVGDARDDLLQVFYDVDVRRAARVSAELGAGFGARGDHG